MTEHQKTLLELNQCKERFLHALKAAHICVFEVDLRGQLYTFFENAEDIFGVSGDHILKEVRMFSPPGRIFLSFKAHCRGGAKGCPGGNYKRT